jgi:hypothetical protein
MSRRVDVRVPISEVRSRDGAVVAADRWLRASFALEPNARFGKGVERIIEHIVVPRERDWLLEGFRGAFAAAGREVPARVRIRSVSEFSNEERAGSAAAAVAGVVGARGLAALALDDAAVVEIAVALGQPADHVRASMAGHVCAVHHTCDDDIPTAREANHA